MELATHCINGTLRSGDFVLSTIESEYPCLLGRVSEILPGWPLNRSAEAHSETVSVDFRQDYSDERVKQIEEAMSVLCGKKWSMAQPGLERIMMPPDCLIRLSSSDMSVIPSVLEDEKYAIVFAYRTVSRLLRSQRRAPGMRPVKGKHYEEIDGASKLIPFGIGWFHQWGISSQETAAGMESNTVALVEMPDGMVREVYPNHMEFIVDDRQIQ